MVDVRNLVEQATESLARAAEPLTRAAADAAEAGEALAAQGRQASEALSGALLGAFRALPDMEVPRVKKTLEQVADQLGAIGERLRRLSGRLATAGSRLSEPALQTSGKLVVDGFEVAAHGVGLLQPEEAGLWRFVPPVIGQPYLDGIKTIHLGLSTASDLARLCVESLPDLGEGLSDVAEDLGRAADLLDGTKQTIRDLAGLFPI
jgi:hypothetical protein